MPKDVLVHFIHSESLRIENEYQVFKAAMDWILHNPAEGRKHIIEIMKPVRFPIIPQKQMDKYIQLLADTNISLHVALQKILSASHIEPHLTVSRKWAGKSIYVLGGLGGSVRFDHSNVIQRYDTFDMTWHDVPSQFKNLNDCEAGVINGQVCVVGGKDDQTFACVETYDPIAHEWTLLPNTTSIRRILCVCTMDNCLYAIGSALWDWDKNEITIEKYDPNDNCWSVIVHGNKKITDVESVTADNGLIYFIGLCEANSFNPVTKEWVTLSRLMHNTLDTIVTVLDGYMYAVGGIHVEDDETDVALSSVQRLRISSLPKGRWREVSPMSCGRISPCVVTVNDMLYVMGGETSKWGLDGRLAERILLDSMECYDPKTDTWTDMGCMPIGRAEGVAVVI